jgi:hypothetical protein
MSKDKLCDTCKKEKAVIVERDIFYSCVKVYVETKVEARTKETSKEPFEDKRDKQESGLNHNE